MKRQDRERLLDAIESLEHSVSQVAEATSSLLEPLRDLDDEQRDAVVMLGLLLQSIAFIKRPPAMMREDLLVQFKEELNAVCPPLGDAALSMDPCISATVAYLTALKDCEDDGKTEKDCPEAWGPGAQSVMCTMKMIEEMKSEIEIRLLGQRPPKPIPWPVEQARKGEP
jgi:hypothetical protein